MLEVNGVDVSEAYSPPRITAAAQKFGLEGGSSFDITGTDERGVPWDLSRPCMQRKAEAIIDREDPFVLISSVMCRDWCQMMRINWPKNGSSRT